MKRNLKQLLTVVIFVCALLVGVTACGGKETLEGTYKYSDSEYITIVSVESETKAYVDVHNLTVSGKLSNYSAENLGISIAKSDSDIKTFNTTIGGQNITGTIDVSKYQITIGSKVYKK